MSYAYLFKYIIIGDNGAIFSPFVFLVIAFGDAGVVVGLWPLHLFWSIYCLIRTNKFGIYMKILLICLVLIPIAIWTILGVGECAIMGVGYGFVWPIMETFRAISKKDLPFHTRLSKCFMDGTWSQVQGACIIVRDFADFSFHTYFSFMDGLLDSKGENPIELKCRKQGKQSMAPPTNKSFSLIKLYYCNLVLWLLQLLLLLVYYSMIIMYVCMLIMAKCLLNEFKVNARRESESSPWIICMGKAHVVNHTRYILL